VRVGAEELVGLVGAGADEARLGRAGVVVALAAVAQSTCHARPAAVATAVAALAHAPRATHRGVRTATARTSLDVVAVRSADVSLEPFILQ
jgi:hypothetical protein